jgi:uncharacterized protein YgbK (DUF1537 family)
MITKTLVVADDLTGAQDTAIRFRTPGSRVQVALSIDSLLDQWDTSDVWALNMDTRVLAPADAFKRVCHYLAALKDRRYFLYQKIDSTIRGNVGSEIEATLRTSGKSVAVVAPALPRNGRTIVAGRAYVDGVPLDRTAVGRDLFVAVMTSQVPELIRQQTSLAAVSVPLESVRGGALQDLVDRYRRAASSPTILVCDSETDSDLVAIGSLRRDDDVLFVGSSGLAGALCSDARHGLPALPFLLLVGSLNPASQMQADRLAQRRSVFCVEVDARRAAASPAEELRCAAALLRAAGELDGRHVLVRCTSEPLAASGVESSRAIGQRIADCMSGVALEVLQASPRRLLFSTGGDLSSRFLAALGAESVRLLDEAEPGVPFGIINGGTFEGSFLFSKAGGFGEPDVLCKIVEGSSA